MKCHTITWHRRHVMPRTHLLCGLCDHINITLPPSSVLVSLQRTYPRTALHSASRTFIPESLPTSRFLDLPSLFCPLWLSSTSPGHSRARPSLLLNPQSHFLQAKKNVPKCTRVPCLLNNISSRPFTTQSSLALHTAEFLSWKAFESRNLGQKH